MGPARAPVPHLLHLLYQVVSADSGSTGLSTAEGESPDLILCDVRMPGMTGLEFLERYRSEGGDALVLVMTAYGSMDLAVEAMGKGAYDYIAKPFGAEEVLLVVRKAEERERLYREVGRLRTEVAADKRFGDFVARSPASLRSISSRTWRRPRAVGASGKRAMPLSAKLTDLTSIQCLGLPGRWCRKSKRLAPCRTSARSPSAARIPGIAPSRSSPSANRLARAASTETQTTGRPGAATRATV